MLHKQTWSRALVGRSGSMNAVKKYIICIVVGLLVGSVAATVFSSRVHSERLRDAEADYFERTAAVESRSRELAARARELEDQLTASIQNAAELREQLDASRRAAEQLRIANQHLGESIAAVTAENNRLRESLTAATSQLDGAISTGEGITERIERIAELVRELQN